MFNILNISNLKIEFAILCRDVDILTVVEVTHSNNMFYITVTDVYSTDMIVCSINTVANYMTLATVFTDNDSQICLPTKIYTCKSFDDIKNNWHDCLYKNLPTYAKGCRNKKILNILTCM